MFDKIRMNYCYFWIGIWYIIYYDFMKITYNIFTLHLINYKKDLMNILIRKY